MRITIVPQKYTKTLIKKYTTRKAPSASTSLYTAVHGMVDQI